MFPISLSLCGMRVDCLQCCLFDLVMNVYIFFVFKGWGEKRTLHALLTSPAN